MRPSFNKKVCAVLLHKFTRNQRKYHFILVFRLIYSLQKQNHRVDRHVGIWNSHVGDLLIRPDAVWRCAKCGGAAARARGSPPGQARVLPRRSLCADAAGWSYCFFALLPHSILCSALSLGARILYVCISRAKCKTLHIQSLAKRFLYSTQKMRILTIFLTLTVPLANA